MTHSIKIFTRPLYGRILGGLQNVECYTYALDGETWKKTVTFLHEQAPEPVSGKTTRKNIFYDRVGNIVERTQEVFLDGAWRLIDRIVYEYDIEGHVIKETDFAGRVTTTVWGGNCCGKTSMTLPGGTRFTYTYDGEGRLIAETKLDPLPCITHFEYDLLGRVVKTWKDGLNPETTAYDVFGQVFSQTDVRGGVTQTAYSLDGNTVTTTFPNGGTQIRKTDALGRLLEISGTAVQPQVFAYGPLWERIATGARWQQTEQNLLGQTVRQTRSGANGSTLETLTAYDDYGRVAQITAAGQPVQSYIYDVTGTQTALTQTVGEEWRKQQSETEYLLRDGNVWQKQTAVQSCSDADIVPLTQQNLTRLSGLSPECSFESESVCPRGNITRTYGTDAERVTVYPSRTNPEIVCYAFGNLVETVDSACVTNRFEVDALGRQVATVDGRGNRTVYAYDAKNNLVSSTDAIGAVTAYGYDVMGQTVAVTNALGNVTVYDYDLRGNKTYEGGATYPVRYTYDAFGNRTSMTTYRNEASGVGDTTTWTYDAASGVLLAKTYADNKGLTYTYTNDGKIATRTSARDIVTTYTYDGWGQLLATDYSDLTPPIAYTYDALGRQKQATDASGTTTFAYDAFGDVVSESNLKTLTRHYDTFGRDVGYSVDGDRKATIVYDPATARIASMDGFTWDYLPGSNLKSRLTYPNGATAEWIYEPHRDLLTCVRNAAAGKVLSQFDYTCDALGRRTTIVKSGSAYATPITETYAYDTRDQLISGQGLSYAYDDIGNRVTAEGKTYVANALNQYTKIDDFTPQYDADGNQTLIQTSTGIWMLVYDAENRLTSGSTMDGTLKLTFSYDYAGRLFCYRVEDKTLLKSKQTDFIYRDYHCIQEITNGRITDWVWGEEDQKGLRSLIVKIIEKESSTSLFSDGNCNISDLYSTKNGIASISNVAYAPFGATSTDSAKMIDFGFSSERTLSEIDAVYFYARFYIPSIGRWLTRDLLENVNLYGFTHNDVINRRDILGLTEAQPLEPCPQGAKTRKTSMGTLYRSAEQNENKIEVNGCGTKDGIRVPERFGAINFRDCCNNHDRCYSSCGQTQTNCDKALGDCIRSKCRGIPLASIASQCRAVADTYEFAVSHGGTGAYEDAQDKHCKWYRCCPVSGYLQGSEIPTISSLLQEMP